MIKELIFSTFSRTTIIWFLLPLFFTTLPVYAIEYYWRKEVVFFFPSLFYCPSDGNLTLIVISCDHHDFQSRKEQTYLCCPHMITYHFMGTHFNLYLSNNSVFECCLFIPDQSPWKHFLYIHILLTSVSVTLRGHNWTHFVHMLQCTVTPNSNFAILKKLKLISIRVKELFEPIALGKKGDGFLALFKSIFLRNRSLSNARWFYSKKRKIRKGNLYLTENRLGRN